MSEPAEPAAPGPDQPSPAAEQASDDPTRWGRIDPDGTVYVRTADGERAIGSWQAGSPNEGLAYYARRYADLEAEVAVLEARAAAADLSAVAASAGKLRAALPEARALGDLDALDRRLAAVLDVVDRRKAERADQRAAAASAAAASKQALVEQAQQLAKSEDWRATGDAFRELVEQWKAIKGVDRKRDSEMWEAFSSARKEFDRRRRVHFAELEKSREQAKSVKERLAAEAEKLRESTEWAATARRFKDLMAEWKQAGRAGRDLDDALWQRFKQAQDAFFTRRSESLSVRDAELRANAEAKEALLAEAEQLDPVSDLEGARKRLRTLHDKWEKIGKVPRESMHSLEERLAAVERKVRAAGEQHRPVTVTESPLVIRLRESVQKLEARLARAQSTGDERLATETATALETQREWLAQAENTAG